MAMSALTPVLRCLSRLKGYPAADLSDTELLAMLLRSGTHGQDVVIGLYEREESARLPRRRLKTSVESDAPKEPADVFRIVFEADTLCAYDIEEA